MVASKGIFARALLLCCAGLASQSPIAAQEVLTSTEELKDDYELIAGVTPDSTRKAPLELRDASGSPDRSPVPDPVPLPLPITLSSKVGKNSGALERAYLDAFSILAGANKCSALLGGRQSITALNELVKQLGTKNLPRSVAMQMSGPTTTFTSNRTGFTYRLFARADLNLDGLFFRGNFTNQPRVPSIGGFSPNTREARVTVLLHELGHLVKGSDKQWLLPDDGESELLSVANTARILEVCRASIKQVTEDR